MDRPKNLPGDDTYPEYTLECPACKEQTTIAAAQDVVKDITCPTCGHAMNVLYVSFPNNGPGFQEGYDPEKIIYGISPDCPSSSPDLYDTTS